MPRPSLPRAVTTPAPIRRTKIIATLGPASTEDRVLRQLLAAGMDVARLNFSHGTRAGHGQVIRRLRQLARESDVPLAILQDLQGPKIRVGRLAHPIRLQEGMRVVLTTRRVIGDDERIPIAFPRLPRLLPPGTRILMKDGMIELEALERRGHEVRCRVVRGGTLGEHQGVNLPGVRFHGPALTPKDVADLRFGVRRGVDYVALSFVRQAGDLRHARRILRRLGKSVPLVAKLEKAEAIAHLDGIIAEADAVMVARGDLGVECAPEGVPLLQKRIIARANEEGIPVITATQMLESMVHEERPTRAETSDVANAILDGTDAVMLSAETAAGEHPVEAVQEMARIARTVETGTRFQGPSRRPPRPSLLHAIGAAAEALAEDLPVAMIVVLTATGRSARLLSQLRPPAPVLACTEDERAARRLSLYWGVRPLVIPFRGTTEAMIGFLDRELTLRRFVRPGDVLAIVGSVPIAARGRTNFVQIHRVGPPARRTGSRAPRERDGGRAARGDEREES
ncbi:MAG TPA: pyruvate kinase [bacterium]|nr:pyruvate kinase [bacterium]